MPRRGMRRALKEQKPVIGPAIKRAGETAARAVYKTANPTVKKAGSTLVKGLNAYGNFADSVAKKIEPYANKLPKAPQRSPIRRKYR